MKTGETREDLTLFYNRYVKDESEEHLQMVYRNLVTACVKARLAGIDPENIEVRAIVIKQELIKRR